MVGTPAGQPFSIPIIRFIRISTCRVMSAVLPRLSLIVGTDCVCHELPLHVLHQKQGELKIPCLYNACAIGDCYPMGSTGTAYAHFTLQHSKYQRFIGRARQFDMFYRTVAADRFFVPGGVLLDERVEERYAG